MTGEAMVRSLRLAPRQRPTGSTVSELATKLG
jgi:hypothetical protein